MSEQLTEEGVQTLRDALDRFEGEKERAMVTRDRLRELASEISDLVESFEQGIDDIEDGIGLIRNGLDQLSQFV